MVQGVEIDVLGAMLLSGKETERQRDAAEKPLEQRVIGY